MPWSHCTSVMCKARTALDIDRIARLTSAPRRWRAAAMKVMVLADYHDMRIEERPHPELRPGEVIIQVRATGICGSDLHGYLGHDTTRSPGMILGHEVAGVVVASTTERFPEVML